MTCFIVNAIDKMRTVDYDNRYNYHSFFCNCSFYQYHYGISGVIIITIIYLLISTVQLFGYKTAVVIISLILIVSSVLTLFLLLFS